MSVSRTILHHHLHSIHQPNLKLMMSFIPKRIGEKEERKKIPHGVSVSCRLQGEKTHTHTYRPPDITITTWRRMDLEMSTKFSSFFSFVSSSSLKVQERKKGDKSRREMSKIEEKKPRNGLRR